MRSCDPGKKTITSPLLLPQPHDLLADPSIHPNGARYLTVAGNFLLTPLWQPRRQEMMPNLKKSSKEQLPD